jgi:murein tripeptide amidase MpaA
MPELRFDTYYQFADLTAILQDFAARFPALCALEAIGKSHEGREIWLATLTNTAAGPAADKPAFWVDANIHATEVSPSACALYTIHKILTGYGGNPQITRLLDTRALYIVPRFNPDGAELFLDERHRRIRSSTRPYPLPEPQDGLHEQDVDGDGRMLMMRVRDPNGPWKVHPSDARLLIPRDPADSNADGPHYRLLPEGLIRNYDGVQIKTPPPLEGLDLNRNFPFEWAVESEQRGAGPYPTSEPEVRAIVAFIAEHPNITGAITFHTYSAAYLRPYGTHPDEHLPAEDLWRFQEIGKHATRLTGYPAVSVFHDFKYHPQRTIKGVFDDWLYEHFGLYAWTCELWSPLVRAGIEMKKPSGGYQFIDWYRDHPVDDDLKLLKWNDEALGGRGFVNWYAFNHPQLGEVELGGWDDDYCWRNPPPHLLEKEIAPHADFILWHALISPLLEFKDLTVTPLGEDAYHLRAVVQNTGWLPTYLSQRAKDKGLVRAVEAELILPDGAALVSGERKISLGQLEGRALKQTMYWGEDPTDDRAKAEWVVRAPRGATLTVTAQHQRAGKVSRQVVLGGE